MTEILQGKLKVYKSSAGSGKTYTLAKEYLKLLLTHRETEEQQGTENYFRHILAITFTNDAANEMKERVLLYLKEFSDLNESDEHKLLNQIHQEINSEFPHLDISIKEIKERSGIILKSILHRFSDFNIQTIDSFTNQIARSFTRELGLPGNYEIYLDTKLKLAESVDLMLAQLDDKEKSLLKWLFDFVKDRIAEDKSWNISYNLKDFSETLVDEGVYELLESLRDWNLEDFERAKKEISVGYSKLMAECKDIAKGGLEYLASQELHTDDLRQKGKGVKSYFDSNYKEPFSKPIAKLRMEMLENNSWLNEKAVPSSDSFDEANLNISIYAGKLHQFLTENNGRFIVFKSLLSNFYELALLNKIKAILEELKVRNDQAFLSDLNEKIRNVVLNEPIPFIYEKAGVRYKHLLIDEFQDTSVFQWINLIPLISNSLADGNVNLIVGDVKQSIYRWRGADPDILVNLPDSKIELKFLPIREHVSSWSKLVDIKALDSNWRSKPGIVNFNNDFFEWLKVNNEIYPGLGHYYDDVRQKPEQEGDSDIRIDLLTEKDFDNKDDMQESKGQLVIDYINQCSKIGYTWRDIAILCRRKEDNRRVSEILVDNNIAIISDESLLLENSASVRIILRILQFLNEPGNQENCADLFLSIAEFQKIKDVDWKRLKTNLNVKSASEFISFINDFFKLDYEKSNLEQGTVFQIAQSWIDAFQLAKDPKQQVYIDYFLDVLYEHTNKPDSGLAQFLDYWEDQKDSLSISSTRDQNAVRILTIHKSKGLEYPVVIIPYPELSYSIMSGSKIWVEMPKEFSSELPVAVLDLKQDLEETVFEQDYTREKNARFIEEVNAMYVSMTRAEERLYIIGSKPSRKNMSNYILDYLNAREIQSNLIKGENFEYETFSIEENKEEIKTGIEKPVKPWDNSKFQRSRLNRNLRWSVDFTLSKEQLERIEAGKSFHLLMSFFKTENDLNKVFQIAADIYKEASDLSKFKEFINKLLSDIEINPFFQSKWKIHTEKAILYNGEILRPDRFQIEGNKIVIIDYKTGVPDQKHSEQIFKYEKGLREVFPDFQFRKFLIYTEPFRFVNVS